MTSEHENMVRWWTITLISVLNGLALASEAMTLVEGSEDVAKVSMEVMRDMTASYTPEQKQLLATQLALLSGLVNRSW
jgi:hypothetical protein